MAQVYAQRAGQPDAWVMSGAPASTAIWLSRDTPINYSDGTSDTVLANTPAQIVGGGTSFNRTNDVFVPFIYKGDPTLRIIKESLLPTLTSDYHPMARVELHGIKPYQPEPYLAAGGLGASPTTPLASVSAAAGAGKAFIVTGSEPAGWQDPGFDDSAWGAVLADPTVRTPATPLSGAAWVTAQTGTQANAAVFLLRHTFVAPTAVISGAILSVQEDNYAQVYLNGTLVYTYNREATDPSGPHSADVLAQLLPGRTNTLAVHIENSTLPGPGPYAVVYQIALAGGSGSGPGLVNPGGAEGDLLTYHGGAWVDLGLGPSGDVLTSNGTDPAWAAPATSGTVTSVQVAVPAPLSASGGPITASGTITLAWAGGQSANRVLASPDGTTGAVSLRALVGNDIPVDASTIVSSAGTIKGNYQAGSGVSISGNTISAVGSGGSVTSVALTMPSSVFSTAGSPITTNGTLAVSLQSQAAHAFWGGPASGSSAAPTFRALAGSDLPAAAGAGGHIHAHGHFH